MTLHSYAYNWVAVQCILKCKKNVYKVICDQIIKKTIIKFTFKAQSICYSWHMKQDISEEDPGSGKGRGGTHL